VLEELKQGETQTEKEFSNDLDALCEMWHEKLGSRGWRTSGVALKDKKLWQLRCCAPPPVAHDMRE